MNFRTFGVNTFGDHQDGERALMRGVLINAWRDLKSKNRNEKEEATRWFLDNREGNLFSFVSVCSYLGLKPNWIRKRLGLA